MQPWDRLPDEPDNAFDAFVEFLNLGPDRNITEAYRRRTGRPGDPKVRPSGAYRKLTEQWKWLERAEAWDKHFRMIQIASIEKAVESGASDAANRIAAIRKKHLELAEAMAERALLVIRSEEARPGALNEAARLAETSEKLTKVAEDTFLLGKQMKDEFDGWTEEELEYYAETGKELKK